MRNTYRVYSTIRLARHKGLSVGNCTFSELYSYPERSIVCMLVCHILSAVRVRLRAFRHQDKHNPPSRVFIRLRLVGIPILRGRGIKAGNGDIKSARARGRSGPGQGPVTKQPKSGGQTGHRHRDRRSGGDGQCTKAFRIWHDRALLHVRVPPTRGASLVSPYLVVSSSPLVLCHSSLFVNGYVSSRGLLL